MNTALLLVDIQNDYFPGGNMELEGSIEASIKANKVLSHFREKKLPVIHIQHFSLHKGATFFVPETGGVEIHEHVKPRSDEVVVEKHYPNGFRETPLLDLLNEREVRRLVICGMMTHMCVDATLRAAFDYGFECLVVGDACASRALSYQDNIIPADHVHGAFMAAFSPIYAKIMNADEVVSTLE